MGAYICNRCDRCFDSSEVVCYEDPTDDTKLICEDCHEELEDEDD